MRVTKIIISLAAMLLAVGPSLAQKGKPIPRYEQSKYIVSAKAGVVNTVEGETSVLGFKPFAMPETLIAGDELRMGDTVRTGTTGRVEILLNPGCYLRLGENSEVVFLFDGLVSNKVKLLRGSAILEASVIDGLILVETPKAKFDIVRDGLYRFNLAADGKVEVVVRKGRVLAGKSAIKNGKRATVEGNTTAIAALNKKEVDQLDDWSKQRARTLIAANSNLSNSLMRRTLGMSLLSNSWIYDPFCRCYTFLPSTGGFSSPYGWGYSVCNPYWYYSPRYNNGSSSGGSYAGGQPSSGGETSGGGSSGGGNSGGGTRYMPSPTSSGGGKVDHSAGGSTGGSTGGHERPAKP